MLVGREHDLAELVSLIGQPLDQPGALRIVQLDGQKGVGKSTLLASVAAELDVPVYLTRGEQNTAASALAGQRTFIEMLLKSPLETVLNEETVHTLAVRCAAAMGREHTVLVVDDAHWLSPSSEEFICALLQAPTTPPLTIVLAHRTGGSSNTVLTAARRHGAVHTHFTVEPLPPEAVDELLSDLPPPQALSVATHAKGNPLFIQIAVAVLKRHPEAFTLEEALRFEQDAGSDLLSTAIADDVASIPAEALGVLETAVVLADMWTADKGFSLFSGDRNAYDQALTLLKEGGLLTGRAYEVIHPVVRLSVYQHIPLARRSDLHRTAAHLPEADLLTRTEHLGQLGAELTEGEVRTLVAGARVMLGVEPAGTVRTLAALAEQHRTSEVEILTARAEIMIGALQQAIARLEPLVLALPDNSEPLILLANALRMAGEAEESRALLKSFPYPRSPALLRELLDVTALIDGHAPAQYVAELRKYDEPDHKHVSDIYDVMRLLSVGNVAVAHERFLNVPEWVRTSPQEVLRDSIHAVACAAWCCYMLDEHENALAIADRGLSAAQKFGRASALPNLATARAFALVQLGRIPEAEEAALSARSVSETYGAPDLATMARAAYLLCSLPRNDVEEISARYHELASAPLPQFAWWRYAVMAIRIRGSLVVGMPESYEPLLSAPIDALTGMRHADIALAAASAGNHELAQHYLERGVEVTRRQGSAPQEALINLARAAIALNGTNFEEWEKSREQLERAREVFISRKMGLQIGRTDTLLADVQNKLRARQSPWERLTPRERQVSAHLIDGLTNYQIGTRLNISSRTVEDHTARVLKKLDAPSRARAAAILSKYPPQA